ncbi:MAG: rRNA pseudouridine synthase [Actinobacteria bacterium]|nr:MAG: rRNA pseudouridine synthase [Actinomycetota bacterium]
MRLNSFLAKAGVASRRKAEDYILAGKVKVNGKITKELSTIVNSQKDVVEIDGKILQVTAHSYYLFNKPKGYITAASDQLDKKSIFHLLGGIKERVFPVGRLDFDSTGLLILTNDGELAYRLIHPKYKVAKTYEVVLDKVLEEKDRKQLEKGVVLEDGLTMPAKARSRDKSALITITEGRKRQVKRMFAFLDYQVKELNRVSFGPLKLDIGKGKHRKLKKVEIEQLKRAANQL